MIRLPIDTKSLYFNIKNDNRTGHTATVATPLRQGASVHEELAQIYGIPENINSQSRECLIAKILKNSRAEAIITNIYVFDKIAVNGNLLENTPSFCMYIREETSKENIHCGRQKVHYPLSLKYEDENIEINNKNVVKAISDKLFDYAFLIEAFEYDEQTGILNFDALIVGEHGIPYSKVFLNKRGVGSKFIVSFGEIAEAYDTEIIALRENLGYENVGPENYHDIQKMNKNNSILIAQESLMEQGASKIRCLTDEYPYAIYDLEVVLENRKQYVIVRNTATKLKYFTLPYYKIRFCMDFEENVKIALVTDVNGEPEIDWFTINEINDMNKSINSITYEKRG